MNKKFIKTGQSIQPEFPKGPMPDVYTKPVVPTVVNNPTINPGLTPHEQIAQQHANSAYRGTYTGLTQQQVNDVNNILSKAIQLTKNKGLGNIDVASNIYNIAARMGKQNLIKPTMDRWHAYTANVGKDNWYNKAGGVARVEEAPAIKPVIKPTIQPQAQLGNITGTNIPYTANNYLDFNSWKAIAQPNIQMTADDMTGEQSYNVKLRNLWLDYINNWNAETKKRTGTY